MAKILSPQDIPSGLAKGYSAALSTKETGEDILHIRRRPPFRIGTLQGCREIRPPIPRGAKVSDAMCANRHVFCDCVKCFQRQPQSGGVEPPNEGPRNRSWWFNDAIWTGWWYFCYFMKLTLDSYATETVPAWCKIFTEETTFVRDDAPNQNYDGSNVIYPAYRPTYKAYALIKTPPAGEYTTLYLRVYRFWTDIGPTTVKVNAYEIWDGWDEATVTWNTMPIKGSKLITINITEADTNKTLPFHVGKVKAVLLEMDPTTQGRVEFLSDDAATYRPFWT